MKLTSMRFALILFVCMSSLILSQPITTHATSGSCSVTTDGPGPSTVVVTLAVKLGDKIHAYIVTGNAGGILSLSITYPSSSFTGSNPTPGAVDTFSTLSAVAANGTATFTFNGTVGYAYFIEICPATTVPVLFSDGRLNNNDAAETAAIYCLADGSVRVYVYAEPKWAVSFTASPEEIATIATKPAKNTLIKQGWKAQLYRLTTGQLQVNAPGADGAKGDYVFIFTNC
jgi:hypothetical protein